MAGQRTVAPVPPKPWDRDRMLRFVTDAVTLLVDNEADVSIEMRGGQYNVVFLVTVHEDDVRHLIGKDGLTVAQIRLLLNTACRKVGIHYNFEVIT